MREEITTFTTDSFILASFLMCQSIRLISLDKSFPKRVVFKFEESEQRRKVSEDFFQYKGLVEPHKFYSAQKDLKQMIYQDR